MKQAAGTSAKSEAIIRLRNAAGHIKMAISLIHAASGQGDYTDALERFECAEDALNEARESLAELIAA